LNYERTFITFAKINITTMKVSLMKNFLIVLPVILFVDFFLMVLLGCASCLFGFGDNFYCGGYCLIGKLILLLSAILFGYLVYPDIRHLFKSGKNASATKE